MDQTADQDQMEAMLNLLKTEHPAEAAVLAQLDKVLGAEREVKRAQITLLLHLRGKLRADQLAKLQQLRRGH